MRADGAAPRTGIRGQRLIDGDRGIIPEPVPESIRSRLAAEGVTTLDDWRRLGRRRLSIWGVTRQTVALIDRIAREAGP